MIPVTEPIQNQQATKVTTATVTPYITNLHKAFSIEQYVAWLQWVYFLIRTILYMEVHLKITMNDISRVKILDHLEQLIENILFMDIMKYPSLDGGM